MSFELSEEESDINYSSTKFISKLKYRAYHMVYR